jgi:hypothetical protein
MEPHLMHALNPQIKNIYYVHVNGAAGVLGLADLVFQDSDGLTPLSNGFYQAPAMLSGGMIGFKLKMESVIQTRQLYIWY